MMAHTPYVEESMSAECVYLECEHEDWNDCPTQPVVACRGCMDDNPRCEPDYERTVIEWPCVFATRRGEVDDELKVRMLAEFSG